MTFKLSGRSLARLNVKILDSFSADNFLAVVTVTDCYPKVKWSVNKRTLRSVLKEIRIWQKGNEMQKDQKSFQQCNAQHHNWDVKQLTVDEGGRHCVCPGKLRPNIVLCSCTINSFMSMLEGQQLLFLPSLAICSFSCSNNHKQSPDWKQISAL